MCISVYGHTFCLLTAMPSTERSVTYVIPKNFNGFLFLASGMPGGLMPDRKFDFSDEKSEWPSSIVLEFDDQGVARYGYESIPPNGYRQVMKERETGFLLPCANFKKDLGKPLPKRGVLRNGGMGIYRKNRTAFHVEVFLVGDTAQLPDSLIDYKREEIDRLLLKHFGLPLPEKPGPMDKK
jgi:hypothetical protein